ncbi:MAG: hypothetical protein JWR67_1128 [Mucilaginibacter sp.]|nr:hypothetical protein [Mucilaginibacter sp.]
MGKETITDLVKFLTPYPDHVQETALWLRNFIWDLYPDSNELIYDNYNAVAFGFAPTDKAGDVFCSIAACSNHVNFGFNRGVEIADPDKILLGNGNLYRFIRVTNINDFPEDYIKGLLQEAYANSITRLKDGKQMLKGQTITKSISPVKRRPK